MEAKTGRIVAATQRPNFNPNDKTIAQSFGLIY